MPIYEYRCAKCGDFELMRKFSDPPVEKCPTCRRKVTKLMSNTSFQLKGSGWYVTDYGKSGSASSKKGDAAETKAGDTSTSTDSGSTSESKAESKPKSKSKVTKAA